MNLSDFSDSSICKAQVNVSNNFISIGVHARQKIGQKHLQVLEMCKIALSHGEICIDPVSGDVSNRAEKPLRLLRKRFATFPRFPSARFTIRLEAVQSRRGWSSGSKTQIPSTTDWLRFCWMEKKNSRVARQKPGSLRARFANAELMLVSSSSAPSSSAPFLGPANGIGRRKTPMLATDTYNHANFFLEKAGSLSCRILLQRTGSPSLSN